MNPSSQEFLFHIGHMLNEFREAHGWNQDELLARIQKHFPMAYKRLMDIRYGGIANMDTFMALMEFMDAEISIKFPELDEITY